jgi:hypothetical protein
MAFTSFVHPWRSPVKTLDERPSSILVTAIVCFDQILPDSERGDEKSVLLGSSLPRRDHQERKQKATIPTGTDEMFSTIRGVHQMEGSRGGPGRSFEVNQPSIRGESQFIELGDDTAHIQVCVANTMDLVKWLSASVNMPGISS